MLSNLKKRVVSLFSRPMNSDPVFRVLDFNQNNSEVSYQLCGKDIIANKKLENLLKEALEVRGFSNDDQNLLLNIFIEKIQEKNLKIIQISFEADSHVIELFDKKSNEVTVLTLNELINDSVMKNNLEVADLEKLFFIKNY